MALLPACTTPDDQSFRVFASHPLPRTGEGAGFKRERPTAEAFISQLLRGELPDDGGVEGKAVASGGVDPWIRVGIGRLAIAASRKHRAKLILASLLGVVCESAP